MYCLHAANTRRSISSLKSLIAVIAVAISALSTGCAGFDIKQATYQTLRQSECRLYEPDSACQENYQSEFQEYERLRQDFLREMQHGRP